MPILDIGESIKDWTTSRLVRFIKDLFEKDPPGFIGSTTIDNLEVVNTLLIRDQISFLRDPNFHFVGNPGESTFQNSWVNYGAPYNPVGYWKDPFGWVHLTGLAKNGTINTPIFTLPAGLRPAFTVLIGNISNGAIGRLDIGSDGTVVQAAGNNTYVSLENIRFKAR